MTSTFLHEDKKVPPDEMFERDAPTCPRCGHQMSLLRVDTRLSDKGTQSKREYECTRCGAKRTVKLSSEQIEPISS
jgi:DNA-directed RNA polymerase subunit RPC12/RpoP